MLKQIKKILPLAVLIPLIIGTGGYYIGGDKITDCLYASFALYFTNPVLDSYNILIEIARWTAPLAMAVTLLSLIQSVWLRIKWRFAGLSKKNVVVYTDSGRTIKFDESIKVAYPGECVKPYFNNQIIMFSSDEKNLSFYEENIQKLKDKKVYIGINDIEHGLLKNIPGIKIFDINRSIARELWKKIALWKDKNVTPSIAIYGNSSLSNQILLTGLQMNLFSLTQGVQYFFISQDNSYKLRHENIDLMNSDMIIFMDSVSKEFWKIIEKADIVIIADILNCTLFQNIVVNASGKVYYYSQNKGDIGEQLQFGKLIPFGRDEDIFTDENIRNEKLVSRAKRLNDEYAKNNSENGFDWDDLSGFLKESNISSADYIEVLSELIDIISDEELAELEHIRWSRFHYLNYWKYAEQRDNEKRYHNDLKSYKELSTKEREKDMTAVREAKEYRKQKCLGE